MKKPVWVIGLSVITFLFLLSPRSWAQYYSEEKMGGGVYGIAYGSPETFAEFHGFVNLEYFDFQKDGELGRVHGGDSSFDLHNFYFNAIAKIRQNVTAFGEIEYEHGGDELKVDRAFIDWRIADGLAFRLGKFYTPFGLEIKTYQAPARKLVSRPLYTEELLFDEWTDVGVNAYGILGPKPLRFIYDLAVTNGPKGLTEEDTQNTDNNPRKDFIARVSVIPYLAEEIFLEIGGSYAYGKYDDDSRLTVRLFGGDLRLLAMGLELVAEYVGRNGNDATAANFCGGPPPPAHRPEHTVMVTISKLPINSSKTFPGFTL